MYVPEVLVKVVIWSPYVSCVKSQVGLHGDVIGGLVR